jgi:L-erythro-3,5-diaminohexanoate dehydrogenase
VGDHVVTLASLTLTPLRLESVLNVNPGSAQVEVAGTAFVCARAPWGLLPADLDTTLAVEVLDVYGAASHTRRLATGAKVVAVLGCGHAGRLAMAAAREAMGGGMVIAVDIDPAAVTRAVSSGLADVGVVADLQDPLAALAAMDAQGAPAADLTIVVVDAPRCEPFAILATREGGTVLFFSMATSFSSAALTADGMGHDVTMLVGSGYTPDKGQYALDLVRRTPALQRSITVGAGE